MKKVEVDLLLKTLDVLPLQKGKLGTEDFNKRVISIDKLKELLDAMPESK
jgi:hypothetical protein